MPNDEIRLTDPICEPQVSKMWPVGDVWFLILATRPSVQSTDPFKKKINNPVIISESMFEAKKVPATNPQIQ